MKHHIYLLECKDEKGKITYYCGYTSRTPSERLKDHLGHAKNGRKKHYAGRQKSVKVVYSETYDDRKTAMKREREIKKLGSRYKLGLVHGVGNMGERK